MIKTNLIVMIGQLFVLMIFITGCTEKDIAIHTTPENKIAGSIPASNEILKEEGNGSVEENYAHIEISDSVRDVVNHPAFEGFGQFVLPLDRGTYDTRICS